MRRLASDPSYQVAVESDVPLEGPLFVGLSNAGLAGLTAADFRAAELQRYYAELADRMATLDAQESLGSQNFPEDRMLM